MKVVVLISGNGSNLQAIIDKVSSIEICAVISNRADAYGLQRAQQAGIATHVVPHQDFATRHDFDQVLQQKIEQYEPDLVVLAGFMLKLQPEIIHHYYGRMINLHPSLLPKYPGLHPYQQVLAHHDSQHGCSIHFVSEVLDGGPIICRAALEVSVDDTEQTLKSRVQKLEHQLYPQVISWFEQGRVRLEDEKVYLDEQILPKEGHTVLFNE